MKVMFDTNVYISFIRTGANRDQMLSRKSIKYMSAIVLMELWAGAKTRSAERLLTRLQKPYIDAGRIIALHPTLYISIGNFLADLPASHKSLARSAGFLNDVQIAFTARSIGATLYTEDVEHYKIIQQQLGTLKVQYLC